MNSLKVVRKTSGMRIATFGKGTFCTYCSRNCSFTNGNGESMSSVRKPGVVESSIAPNLKQLLRRRYISRYHKYVLHAIYDLLFVKCYHVICYFQIDFVNVTKL